MAGTPEKDIPPPDDFSSEDEFLEWVREQRTDDIDFDRTNRTRGQEDSEFAAGYQWLEADAKRRQEQGAPTLTFNRSFSLLRQKLAARNKVRVSPRIQPESAGKQYEDVAAIREGLIRNIERISDCGACDAVVSQNQLVAGVGAYEVAVDFADNDVFDLDIFIRAVFDPFAVTWDRLSTDPTGRDARHAMIDTLIDIDDFKRAYPNATASSTDSVMDWFKSKFNSSKANLSDWVTDKSIRVATIWRVRERTKRLAMLTSGEIIELPPNVRPEEFVQLDGEGNPDSVLVNPSTGELVVRDSPMQYVEGFITNGTEILKGPFELPIDRVPLIRVPGWTIPIGERVERFGLFSFAKDAMRFHNYVRSDRIERIIFRPRFSWTANEEEVAGRENLWANSHLMRNSIGLHKGPSGGGPQPVEPPTVDQAAILESESAIRDIMDIFDIQERPRQIGKTPPTASSLELLQDISNASNVVFDELYFAGKREVYRTVNQLIPHVFDTPRLVKVLGEDDKLKEAILNDPENPESLDVTSGKYSVSIDVGASQLTRRAQSIEFMKTMINSTPDSAAIVFDQLIELQNIQGGEKLARRWRERFGIQDDDPTPEQLAQAQKQAELELLKQEQELAMAQAELDLKQAEVKLREAEAETKRATTESEIAQAEQRAAAASADTQVAEARIAELRARTAKAEADRRVAESKLRESFSEDESQEQE